MVPETNALVDKARFLVQRMYQAIHPVYGFSTTSCQVYDTAWAAMITKTLNGRTFWLFPESYQFLLDTQGEDGSWSWHTKSKTVGIVDTAAATYALMRHAKAPLQIQEVTDADLRGRINKGIKSLQTQLMYWDDLLSTNHIGVELIVPALLEYLKFEDESLRFDFEGEVILKQMHEAKMARVDIESLYQGRPSSVLHSLEAFIWKIDFDRIGHHLFNGSMLASPSSTAAFLMCTASWSDEAEAYLRHVFLAGSGQGTGGFPGTYPTTYFELNWALSTLIQSGFSPSDLQCDELIRIASIISEGFRSDGGVIGFAPRTLDVDDTAKGLLTLSLLNFHDCITPGPMIKMFEADDHFRTFLGERDPSFTSNCHVLLALLHQPEKLRYLPQIKKAADFLCKSWWNCDGLIKDKWHLSHLYPTMLLAQAFTELIQQAADQDILKNILDAQSLWKVSICLFQACVRTVFSQRNDGSWDGSPEETSYAVLTLVIAGRFVFFETLLPEITEAITKGVAFLRSGRWASTGDYWTSKTAYRVELVAEAYLLAAQKASSDFINGKVAIVGHSLNPLPLSKHREVGYLQLIGQTDLFSSAPTWEVRASLIESALFIPLLRADRLKVYNNRDQIGVSKDHYIDMIPVTWVACNNHSRAYVPTSVLFELMMISMLGYQTDEFIEAVAAPAFANDTQKLHNLINKIIDQQIVAIEPLEAENMSLQELDLSCSGRCDSFDPTLETLSKHNDVGSDKLAMQQSQNTTEASLRHFVHYVLEHQYVRSASIQDQVTLWRELRAFLHAHVVQIADNATRLGGHSGRTGRPFFNWVRTTAADHVACAYSFTFACCLISALIGGGECVFGTVKEVYLAQAIARHMATMCRMCNDIGSFERDLAEGNTNSFDFPEFAEISSLAEKKCLLSELAAYERFCLMNTIDRLAEEVLRCPRSIRASGDFRQSKVKFVRFFASVTDFYDQLYILRDLSSSMQQTRT